MNKTLSIISSAFEEHVEYEGLFWRIARPDTFVDLLMLQAGRARKIGIDDKLAVEVILISVKALVNETLGIKDYTTDYKQLNKELFAERDTIRTEANRILRENLLKLKAKPISLTLADELNYFKVLNNLEIDSYAMDVFENVLITFLSYFNSKVKE